MNDRLALERLANDPVFCTALIAALDARELVLDDVRRHPDRFAGDVRDALLDAGKAAEQN